jgi:hypothetical protein
MTHQEGIANVIQSILVLNNEVLETFKRGNPFDKLLRSYSERNSKGENLYNNWERSFKHYKFSIEAYQAYTQENNLSNLYAEHLIPLSILRNELLQIKNPTVEIVLKVLEEKNIIIIITKNQQKIIDKYFKSKLPENGQDRLTYHGILIHEKTKYNSLL